MGGLDKQSEEGATQNCPSLRLLKEAVMGYRRGDRGCGWHVDDKGFWPCEDTHHDNSQQHNSGFAIKNRDRNPRKIKTLKRNRAGINVWITLSPVTAKEGGGLAVSPGSHNLSGSGKIGKLLRKARRAIASGKSQSTCSLAMLEPTCQEYMEKNKRVYDLQPGDAIIHDRYLFHKPDDFKEGSPESTKDAATKQRISLRYMPSAATFFDNGADVDGAAVHKNLKTGDFLYEAGEYFPQVWPQQLEAEAKVSARQDENFYTTKFLFKLAGRILTSRKKGLGLE